MASTCAQDLFVTVGNDRSKREEAESEALGGASPCLDFASRCERGTDGTINLAYLVYSNIVSK